VRPHDNILGAHYYYYYYFFIWLIADYISHSSTNGLINMTLIADYNTTRLSGLSPTLNGKITHDHRGRKLPPALSQLLSDTVIPRPKYRRRTGSSSTTGSSVLSVFYEPSDSTSYAHSRAINCPSSERLEDEDWIGSVSSSSSITSSSTSFNSSTLSAPTKRQRRIIPQFEASHDDHPLLDDDDDDNDIDNGSEDEDEWTAASQLTEVITKTRRLLGKKSFVSNLTASLKVLSSVASSLSSAQQRMDTANVLAFTPSIMDEPHPSRFMVPTATAVPERKISISLQTYNIQTTLPPHLRPREMRMNCDFYRIYALECLMRQNGKFDPEFQGRAQMILEPRKDYNQSFYVDDGGEFFGIRKRFVSRFDAKVGMPSKRTVPTSCLLHCVCVDD
jgi:hypothetical protein